MKPEYRPKTLVQKLGKLIEECGEVQAAVGKTLRWGLDSTNPELPPEQQETNRDWILRELGDLEEAISIVCGELQLPGRPMPKEPKCEKFEAAPPRDWGDRRKPDAPGPQCPRATCGECFGKRYVYTTDTAPGSVAMVKGDCPACMKPRPPYAPADAPFCWSVDGLGDEVGMWRDGEWVRIYDPKAPHSPWVWHPGADRGYWDRRGGRLSARLWDDANGLWQKVRGG